MSKDLPSAILLTGRYAHHKGSVSQYLNNLVILLGTGLRISEPCGLTESSMDFENRMIIVDHQLLYSKKTGYIY